MFFVIVEFEREYEIEMRDILNEVESVESQMSQLSESMSKKDLMAMVVQKARAVQDMKKWMKEQARELDKFRSGVYKGSPKGSPKDEGLSGASIKTGSGNKMATPPVPVSIYSFNFEV